MKQYKLFVLLIQAICLLPLPAEAGFDRIPQPAPVVGKGVSGVSLLDPLSLWINPASPGTSSKFQASFFYSPSPFQLSQLSSAGVLISGNIFSTGFGIGAHTFGFSLYRENVLTVSAAKNLSENIFLGFGVNCYQTSISGYGNELNIGIDLGLISQLTEAVSLGLSLQNINHPKIGGEDNSIPQVFVTGISYSPVPGAALSVDFVKDIQFPLAYRIGCQLKPIDVITLRAGIQDDTSRLFGGVGFAINGLRFDYAVSSHSELGLTHSIGITIFP